MKNAFFWSAVALVAIALVLKLQKMESFYGWFFNVLILLVSYVHVNRALLVKTSEFGQRPIHGFYCGHQIKDIYFTVCGALGRRLKRSVLVDEIKANSFLRRFDQDSSSTDIVQECCREGCHIEEVWEYC